MKEQENKFKMPSGYFDKMQSEVISQLNIKPENTGYKIPENYFHDLQNNVFQKLNLKEKSKPRFYSLMPLRAAASLAVLIAASLWIFQDNVFEEYRFDDVSDLSVMEYMADEEISLEQMAMILDKTEIEDIVLNEDEIDLDILDETDLHLLEDLL